MGVARQKHVLVFFGKAEQKVEKTFYAVADMEKLVPHIKMHIGKHLVVP